MDAPKCKLCGKPHWSYQPHHFVTDPPEPTTFVTQEPINVTRGRPRLYDTNANRQRAYRERKRNG